MERIYDEQKDTVLKTPEGVEFTLAERFSREEFANLTTDSKETVTSLVEATNGDIRQVSV